MKRSFVTGIVLLALAWPGAFLAGADWNQWRGPERNGVDKSSPPLAEAWGPKGPPRLWLSEDVISSDSLGSIVIADGKAYVFGVWPVNPPPAGADGKSPSWTQAIKEGAMEGVICLDEQGKVLWKKGYSGGGSHSTPCVVSGRCYVYGPTAFYCLDAKTGQEIWKTGVPKLDSSSSPVVADGVAVVLAGPLTAFDANTGNKLWEAPVRGGNCSPVLWTSNGTKYVICRTSSGLVCAKLATGEVAWKIPATGNSTPVISGDVAVFLNIDKANGLAAYRLSAEKPEKLWSVPISDRGSTPVIYNDNVYLTGGRAACYGLNTGDLKWEQPFTGEIASPFIADGKLFGSVAYGAKFLMIRASPEEYKPLGEAGLHANWIPSPCITDGKLYIRSNKGVACYDLRKDSGDAATSAAPEATKR